MNGGGWREEDNSGGRRGGRGAMSHISDLHPSSLLLTLATPSSSPCVRVVMLKA